MQAIEQKAIITYEKNLKFLMQNNRKLFDLVSLYDLHEVGLKQKYELEYEDGYFDVLDITNGVFLYNENSNLHAKKAADKINMKKTDLLFEGIQDWHITKADTLLIKEKAKDKTKRLEDVFLVMHEAMKLAPKDTLMKKIDKFIFIGTGLGIHIAEIHNKIHATEYLIIEDDLELFRLSLFVMPYYELAQDAQIYISVAEDDNVFFETMAYFLEGSFYNNRYLKYYKLETHSDKKIKLIQTALGSQAHHIFPYGVRLEKTLRPLGRIANGYKTADVAKKFTDPIFSQMPALIIASGPSMKKNIAWVEANQNCFFIIAVSSSLKTLQAHGIKPDIIVHIDGFDDPGNSCMPLFDGIDMAGFIKDTTFILGTHSPDALLSILKKENIYFLQDGTRYYSDFESHSGACVGSYTAALAIRMGFKNNYLLGLDLALDQQSGATHSDDHFLNAKQDLSKAYEVNTTISLRGNIVPTKGNFQACVFTLPEFVRSIQALNAYIPSLSDTSQHTYNLNDGAFLEGASPLYIKNIEPLKAFDKSSIDKKINNILLAHSQTYMQEHDIKTMRQRVVNAKEIKCVIEQHASKEFSNENRYMYDLLGVVSDILKFKDTSVESIVGVYNLFFQYSIPYIIDIVNTQKITKIMTHLKKIDMELVSGMLNIINRYIEEIELFLEKIDKTL